MAKTTYRPKVPTEDKKRLINEVGGRCANPGCSNARVEIHHINEWAVYQSHDPRYMIAICPSCHDAVHHGKLEITDETLLRWKNAGKVTRTSDVIFVEPGLEPLIKLGPIEITSAGGLIVFEPSPRNRISYIIENGDIVLASCRTARRDGSNILTITDNRVRFDANDCEYLQSPGHIRLTGRAETILSDWMIKGVRSRLPTFADEPEIIFDIEVIAAGQVSIRGIWADENRALVVNEEGWIIPRTAEAAMLVNGSGRIHWLHPINKGFFETAYKIW